MQAKAGGITAGDLVDLVLDPRRDPFELEKVPVPQRLSFAAGLGQRERPESPPEPPSEALREAMAKEKQQRAARLGVHPSQLRSGPGEGASGHVGAGKLRRPDGAGGVEGPT